MKKNFTHRLLLFALHVTYVVASGDNNDARNQKEFPPALHLEFESCVFSTQQYRVEQSQQITLKWLIPVAVFEGLDIDFHIFVTDVLEETTYDHQQIVPDMSKHLYKNVLVGYLQFAAVSIYAHIIYLLLCTTC